MAISPPVIAIGVCKVGVVDTLAVAPASWGEAPSLVTGAVSTCAGSLATDTLSTLLCRANVSPLFDELFFFVLLATVVVFVTYFPQLIKWG